MPRSGYTGPIAHTDATIVKTLTEHRRRLIVLSLLVALVLSSAGYYFGSATLSRVCGTISMFCVLLGLIYIARFGVPHSDTTEHKNNGPRGNE